MPWRVTNEEDATSFEELPTMMLVASKSGDSDSG